MSTTVIGAATLAKLAAPLVKDLYEGAKGGAKGAMKKWGQSNFPQKFARQMESIDSVRTIWSPEKNLSLRKFYYPSSLVGQGGEKSIVNNINDIGRNNAVIQGIVGQGKSILLRYLAIQEINKSENKRMPLFLELRKISKSLPLVHSIKRALSEFEIDVSNDTFDYLASSGKMVLLLDGFDELDADVIRETTFELEHLSAKYPDLQIIVTSRPGNEVQKLSGFEVLDVAPLSREDHAPFLQALGVGATKAVDIVGAIESSPSKVAELITTPLMLTLVVYVYQSEHQIPPDLPEFFDKLFHTVFTRHDKLKAAFERRHFSGLSELKLKNLFEAFCFMSLQEGHSRTLNRDQFHDAFELSQEYPPASQ